MKHVFAILIVLALSYWSVRPLFSPGFFPMHDDTQPTRVYQMAKSLSDGQFPVRWVPDLGYGFGYPIFNFYAPLPYYIGAVGMFAGIDPLTATKLMMGIGMVIAAISMFFASSRIAGIWAGIAAGLLYLYAPYHAVNLYVRGAVGELWAYGFLPLMTLALYEGITGIFSRASGSRILSVRRGILIGGIGLAAILLSHNILGMIVTMFFIGKILCILLFSFFAQGDTKSRVRQAALFLVSILIVGIGLSAFFTLPAIMEKEYTNVDQLTKGGSDFRQHFVYFDQVWDSPWGYAGSAQGRADGMSFKIGKVHLLLGFISIGMLILLAWRKRLTLPVGILYLLLILLFFVSMFLMLESSQFIWELIPGFSYIQYPWRFLNLIILPLVLFSCALFLDSSLWRQIGMVILITALTLQYNVKYFVPERHDRRQSSDYTDQERLRYDLSKISDEYMPKGFPTPDAPQDEASYMLLGDEKMTTASLLENATTRKVYTAVMDAGSLVSAPVGYFPGWRVTVDGVPTDVVERDGRVSVFVPKGRHTLSLNFSQTPIERMGNAISLFSLFLLGYVSLYGTHYRHGEETDRRDRHTDLQ